ncbi:GD10094 [Drosophila simulans]|uniref:GD10094 n=1 Tax=Drosophila simulans TaxID=7240 RepID=B4QGT8_DROSI|nr:GD10094 [Drosophila simulans]
MDTGRPAPLVVPDDWVLVIVASRLHGIRASCITLLPMIETSDSGAGLTSRTTGVHYGGPPDTGQSLSGDCLISGCQPSNRPIQRPTGSSHAHFASDLEAATSVGKHLAS